MPTVCAAHVAADVPPDDPSDDPPDEDDPPELPPLDGALVRVGEERGLGAGATCTWVGAGEGLACTDDGVREGEAGAGVGVGDTVVGLALVVAIVTIALAEPVCFEPFPSKAPLARPKTTITLRLAIPTCRPLFTDQSCGLHPFRLGGTGWPHLGPF